MNEKLDTDTTENNNFTMNSEEIEYKNLINILKEIKATIDLLEKTIS